MIEVDQLTKCYGSFTAVNAISFDVNKGEILGFLGPNGAGKSTTMRMLTSFITPTSGTARIGGKDIITDSIAVRKMVGYLPESAPSYKNMTVREFLNFIAEVRGFSRMEKKEKLGRVIELTSLEKVRYQSIDTLSKGYKQRVGFAQALIHDPPVLILDEPTEGLDPNQKHEVRRLIKQMAAEKVIILSTHVLEEMEALCDRAIIINQGNLVADGSPESLLAHSELYNVVTLTLAKCPDEIMLQNLVALGAVEKVKLDPKGRNNACVMRVYPKQQQNILSEVNHFLAQQNWSVMEIQREKGQMEEVFRKLTLGAGS
ncbi:MAG: ABC transporter ATP-binding protein [SAR324 cluster bacterium]|uniref:ABC transporter ATP-binding protein n=1 Tax=SAR324 cluster bacterium TaxID=2024889 RepID=A0A2A4TBG1_9DELT|nr:MAG: ABC transporter ATP-binding protein [SAR324 cluster bacterium]